MILNLKKYTMKNILKKIILSVMFLGLTYSCSETKDPIYFDIINNSEKSIYLGFSYSHPDINLKNIDNLPINNKAYKISTGKVYLSKASHFGYNPTTQVFILDADVIESTPWDTIVKYNKVLKRYQFTKTELQNMGWKVVYDGN